MRDEFYIGEMRRPFGLRYKEHLSITWATTTGVGNHLKYSGYALDISLPSALGREDAKSRKPSKSNVGPNIEPGHWLEHPAINRDLAAFKNFES